mmetsp:Transcript_43322/g.109417  ORF Transcript_43322/g.109417 Transcript_43322/m.109417 type:complete len:253 (-) Transcript_43322:1265-2023(-)
MALALQLHVIRPKKRVERQECRHMPHDVHARKVGEVRIFPGRVAFDIQAASVAIPPFQPDLLTDERQKVVKVLSPVFIIEMAFLRLLSLQCQQYSELVAVHVQTLLQVHELFTHSGSRHELCFRRGQHQLRKELHNALEHGLRGQLAAKPCAAKIIAGDEMLHVPNWLAQEAQVELCGWLRVLFDGCNHLNLVGVPQEDVHVGKWKYLVPVKQRVRELRLEVHRHLQLLRRWIVVYETRQIGQHQWHPSFTV